MKRVGIYLRVSTADQSNDAQRLELLAYCERRGWADVREYADTISGAKWTRLGLDMLLADVRRGKLGAVVCEKLDRLGRSLTHLAQILGQLEAHNVALVVPSQGIDTTDGNPAGRLQLHILAAIAEFERSLIRERTKAGLVAARARGAKLGRPKFVLTGRRKGILAAWQAMDPETRPTVAALAKQMDCSVGTAHKLTKEGA